ncbi:hypothetical protein [Actinoplanes nipponensis]
MSMRAVAERVGLTSMALYIPVRRG